jgi:hypothetical protein
MMTMTSAVPYPVRVDASLQPGLSRWLWLVKWLLAIPHFVLLVFLWIAYAVLTLVALVAILVTGRYPRAIFDFNVGVMRWHWRVAYYSYAAFGTDRYPPFTLAEVPGFPAHLEIAYPQRLSRGLALVKWLLAVPHYLVVALFLGGGTWFAWQVQDDRTGPATWGLITLLALIAAVVVLFTGNYPRSIFDFVLGMDRWVLRVTAYVGLMTDEYPPFRLDMGGGEPGGTLTLTGPVGSAPAQPAEPARGPVAGTPPPPAARRGGWTAGRIVAVVVGALLGLVSLGILAGGATTLWADQTQRDGGFLTSDRLTYQTGGYAVTAEDIRFWPGETGVIGDVRIRATSADQAGPVFVGIAREVDAARYLSGVRHSAVTNLGGQTPAYDEYPGAEPAASPAQAGIWVAQASGPGTQSVVWPARNGRWTVVVMNADASARVIADADVGVQAPALPWVAVGLLAAGVGLLAVSVVLVAVPIRRASR